ncbi:serine hydrolase domain-containing protein [Chitinophaga tropicalis]|uniref:Serine hydrolase n=1 Tax=Chitinophaga tropicalis TaxID=2683588 RepID=A0A7K1UD69_9BACT|nr:serine hydrolase domain-containing protein [Chitinophaga tropicalis]MVT12230.1 serine hydrolase [Chitinophaga tropicalis]
MNPSRNDLLLFLTIIWLTIPSLIYGQKKSQERPGDSSYAGLIAESEKYFSNKLKTDKIVGLSAAIIMDGRVVWKNGFGFADRERKIPMTVSTVINIGSVTKTFTALSVMQLQDRGMVDIQHPLKRYLPQFHPLTRTAIHLDAVTVKSVLTHTSGIQSDVWKNSDLGSGRYTDVLGFINGTYLLYPAGMVGLYSNAGYNILGHLIKEVTSQDYADYVHRNIFRVLGMSHSGFAMDRLENRTKIYAYGRQAEEYELRDIASGGIYTDINDLARYAMGMLQAYRGESTALLRQASAIEMFSLQNAQVPLETNKKGLGWFMFRNDSTFAVYHAGSAGFTHAKLLLIPKRNAAVIVMTNTAEGGGAAEEFCFNQLPRFGLSIPDLFPPPISGSVHPGQNQVSPPDSLLEKHAGIYAESNSYNVVKVKDHHLTLTNGSTNLLLKPLTDGGFIPYEVKGADTIRLSDQCLFFKNISGSHFLIRQRNKRDYNLGYCLTSTDIGIWAKRTGLYEHFGYQMLIGDSKFKSAELYLSKDGVLMLRLKTMGSTNEIPLDAISPDYALTSGVNSGFGGFNVKFYEDTLYHVLEFAGLSFRMLK